MSKKRSDFRALRARREAALDRPELRQVKAEKLSTAAIEAAIAAGRLTKLPPKRRRT